MAAKTHNIGQVIREARIALGWQQQEFAVILGIAPEHLSRLEMGHVLPSMSLLNRLAKIISPKQLLPFDEGEGEEKEEVPILTS